MDWISQKLESLLQLAGQPMEPVQLNLFTDLISSSISKLPLEEDVRERVNSSPLGRTISADSTPSFSE